MTSSVYDPLGFVAPIILSAKKLLQDLCKQKLGWDDSISDIVSERWEKWKSQLPSLSEIRVNRCVFEDLKLAELHNFADASQIAYGAVSYLRLVDVEDRIHCAFLAENLAWLTLDLYDCDKIGTVSPCVSRSVRPVYKRGTGHPDHTIDILVRLHLCVTVHQKSVKEVSYICRELSVIHEKSTPTQWRHVGSELNPADEVSRGLTVEEMSANSKWLNGPPFLRKEEEFWPRDPTVHQLELSEDDPEIKRDTQTHSQSLIHHRSEDVVSSLTKQYSSWERLKRAVAWLSRFRTWFIARYGQSTSNGKAQGSLEMTPSLTVDEMQEAKNAVIKHVQRLSFQEVVHALESIDSSQHSRQATCELKKSKIPAHMKKLHPFLDEKGILRVGGRLENALIKFETKHPIVLPYRHHVTELIISRHHQKTGHLGQEYVLSSLRQLYWIIKGRSAVRRVISSCFLCKKLGAVRGEQPMADLPKERLMSGDPPFSHVGVDCFGPLYVRQACSNVKRYGCLFSCLVTRAAHIEVVHPLNIDGFINALRRFIILRGNPTTICRDNGTNFRAGEKEIRESLEDWNQQSIHEFLRQRKVIWKFNPPSASHMGGAWKRIIRSIR